ncbi:MAG: TrmH family RNA methyltransferase, partial [Calditrichia bacterium]
MKKLTLEEISQHRLSPDEILRTRRFPLFVLLDNIRSLYNVGSIFRTADAVRAEKLILTGITGHPPRKEIDKTALGASETVPWEYHKKAVDVVKKLKLKGTPIVILEHTDNVFNYNKFDYQFPVCLVLGNEVFGVQDELLD